MRFVLPSGGSKCPNCRNVIVAILSILCFQCSTSLQAPAQAPPTEAAVTPAFVYDFAEFVESPPACEAKGGLLHRYIRGRAPLGGPARQRKLLRIARIVDNGDW